jgi:hypothetical protein
MKLVVLSLLLCGLTACGGDAPAAGTPAARREKGPSAPRSSPYGIELRRGREPRELVRIGVRGVVIGPQGGPLEWKLFVEPRRADDAWYFLRLYAPFEMKSPAGDLAFRGQGRVRPGAAERRMILEWARQVATEAADGRGGAAYGLALAWHQGGPAGICEDVVLYLTGEAVATACGWESEVRGRLDPGPLAKIYDWFDHLQPFQTSGDEQDESPEPGRLEARLIFAGRGPRFTSPADQREIQSFAAALFAELAARRRGSVPQVSEAPATPPASRLLLPPGAGAGAQEILLQLPEKPPPPPPSRQPPAPPKERGETGAGPSSPPS